MNNRQKGIYERYKNSYRRNLYDCYERFSKNKIHAYENCKRYMEKYDGYDFRIISFNSHIFTVGFKFMDNKGTEFLMYITPSKEEKFIIEEDYENERN